MHVEVPDPRGGPGPALSRVGVLGGTFNPPHVGHLVCAQEARWQLELDRVLLMPVHTPPHKAVESDPGPQRRLALCELAALGEDWLWPSSLELERGGRSYTADTLRELSAASPQDELTLIVGADMAASLPSWREPEAVLALAELAVADREGASREAIGEAVRGVHAATRLRFFDMPRLDVSSSAVRDRIAAGRPVRHLVPDGVLEAIHEAGLYGAREAVA